ncbi:MAG TPA: family 78 glycoside hydrolase catalytic domain [Gemmatimonadales bacterium]|nr:family 78 glycoside hydrolase catalytic domain [Gemmatimonadales bacterium]
MRTSLSIVLSLTLLAPAQGLSQNALSVDGLRVEYLTNPIGIDVVQPRLSWRIASTRRNTMQAAYQLQVGTSEASLTRGANLLWDSGKMVSGASVFVDYGGPQTLSRTRYYWRVRVWDSSGRTSPWSAAAFWETGLLQPGDWTAEWITPPPTAADSLPSPSPFLRRAFRVGDAVRSARLYVTSLGLYEIYLNGQRVGDQLFTPGWTSYRRRLQYQTYDVTALLRSGANVVGAMLGDGWYRGNLGFFRQRNLYGRQLALLAQLEIRYQSGRTERVVSDRDWKASAGPILSSDIYGGETYDARRELSGWAAAGAPYDDRNWTTVGVLVYPPPAALVASLSPPVRRVRELRAVAIRLAPSGETIFDLGQNFTGWARLSVRGPAGTTVTLRFGEVLDREGNLYTANLRAAAQTDRYTLSGNGREVYEPHFTFHGFRYVAVRGLPAPADSATITGIAVSSDLAQTGSLVTSDSLLNQLQRNIVWGQRSNFLDVPTDCPQRDERLGWTGDAQVFARTAAFNMDVAGFFAKWLSDVAADQDPSGSVPWVIPNPLGGDSTHFAGTAGWSDVAVIVPWTMYLTYGDRRLLERQYPSMRAWVDYARRRAGTGLIWRPGWQFGDWLALHSDDPSYPGATTGTDLIATAFLAHSTDLVSRTAAILGHESDAAEYRARFRAIREAFNREFVSRTGRVGENTQTAYTLAIAFDLLPDSLVSVAGGRLAQDVEARDHHLTTGFLGTPYLLHVLGATGHLGDAFALLTQRTYPSWLYPITRGATTMWERWDGIRPDSSFEDPGMNSFNHYAFGAVGDWMYQNIGGIDVDSAGPGYRRARIAPRPGAGLTSASASLQTAYGMLKSAWRLEGRRFVLDVAVPANTSAEVTLWDARVADVREGGVPLDGRDGVRSARQRGNNVIVDVGSGTYSFAVTP